MLFVCKWVVDGLVRLNALHVWIFLAQPFTERLKGLSEKKLLYIYMKWGGRYNSSLLNPWYAQYQGVVVREGEREPWMILYGKGGVWMDAGVVLVEWIK